jgi:zinc D-Ala-D-Ala dipeptidase
MGILSAGSAVNQRLSTMGLGLFVHDALRPIDAQRHFHDVGMPARVREKNPILNELEVMEETERYWANPSTDVSSPAPHATGSATDLTLYFLEPAR